MTTSIILIGLAIFILFLFLSTIKIVPQRSVFIVERLGKDNGAMEADFHILNPFIDKIMYQQTLKEQAMDGEPQTCNTRDNISGEVDGILYLQVIAPQRSSYGIDNYRVAAIQIAQTTMRSVVWKLELDKPF